MDTSSIIQQILSTTSKISSYKSLLMTTQAMYEEMEFQIYKISMEISSGLFEINIGSSDYEGLSNEYIKRSILHGLKKRALTMIEDQVILEFMISEREEQLKVLTDQLDSMQNTVNQQ